MKPNSPERLGPERRRLLAESLKRCPLCGAVNALSNGECFCCRWSGRFEHDPETIEDGVCELIERCPELLDALLHEPTPKPWLRRACDAAITVWHRVEARLRWRRARGHRVDLVA